MKIRIVVIDDEPSYLSLIEAFSASAFCDTKKIDQWDLSVAKELVQNDLLLLDINMPNTNGLEVLRDLEQSNFSGGIVIMSGALESVITSAEDLGRELNLKLVGTLHKPFRLAEFNRLVDKFIKWV